MLELSKSQVVDGTQHGKGSEACLDPHHAQHDLCNDEAPSGWSSRRHGISVNQFVMQAIGRHMLVPPLVLACPGTTVPSQASHRPQQHVLYPPRTYHELMAFS